LTVAAALQRCAARLSGAGIADAALDAELLLRHVTGWDRATLLASPTAKLATEPASRLRKLVEERARRRPLQHLTGTQWFWRHELHVTPDVLIPRPETELLVEAVLEVLDGAARPLAVDVGTGSGCIALSLAAELPEARIHATDISRAALSVAEQNAVRLGLAERVCFHAGDLLEPLMHLAGRFHLVVSNPPYVDPSEAASLAPEVRDHEPHVAVFAPLQRYSVYCRLVPQARQLLGPGGRLVLEVGQAMSDEVSRICSQAGFDVERIVPDLQAIPRVVVARCAD
jgi:release factor glutamine methyltransferase